MSYQADALFVEQYNSRLSIAYQPQGFMLQGMLMPEGRIEGKKAYWPKFGRRVANKKVRGIEATPDDPDMSQVSTDLETWESFNYIHQFDLSRMTANEREAQVQGGAMALGQAIDLEIMSKLDAAAPTSSTGFYDASGGQLSCAGLMVWLGHWFGVNNIPPDGQVYCGIPMIAWQCLMADKVFANSQWVGGDLPFLKMSGSAGRSWNFVNWFIIPNEYLPIPTSNKWDCFMWHKPNVGWSNNKQVQTWWDWENKLGAWSVRQESEGAGIVIRSEATARLRIASNTSSITIA